MTDDKVRFLTVSSQDAPGPQTHEEARQFHEGFLCGATAYATAVGHSALKSDNPKLCEIFDTQGWKTVDMFEKLDAKPTDRDYEIELATLRAELATVKAERDGLKRQLAYYQETLCLPGGQLRALPDADPVPAVEAIKIAELIAERDGLGMSLGMALHDRDDWRDIAIGLRDFGGPPLPKHQRQFGEVLARYLERLRKEGV